MIPRTNKEKVGGNSKEFTEREQAAKTATQIIADLKATRHASIK